MQLNDKVAAITGAGSGIGRALAQDMATQGCNVAIADIDEKGLQETADSLANSGVKVSIHKLDVADREAVYQFADDVVAEHGQVDIVVNNAGVQAAGNVDDLSYDDFEWVININMWGVLYGAKAFLPHLKQRPEACLVNIASINSQVPFEKGCAYNMAKSAVQGLSETLMIELKDSSVNVLSVHPGGIKTNIANNARNSKEKDKQSFNDIAGTTSESCAAQITKAISKERSWLAVGLDAKLLWLLKRLNLSWGLWASKAISSKFNKER